MNNEEDVWAEIFINRKLNEFPNELLFLKYYLLIIS